MIRKTKALAFTLVLIAVPALPASAQQLRNNVMSKTQWHESPREIQILDERPLIKDFREAPSAPATFSLPPGPGAGRGGHGNDDPGGVLPTGGYQLPSAPGQLPYRTDNGSPMGPLPKADFGHAQSNIPARGMGPKGVLPNGSYTGVHGNVSNPYGNFDPAKAAASKGKSYSGHPTAAPPQAATYNPGGGYGPSVGGSGYSAGSSSSSLSGKLLKHVK